jgi:predicted nucleotidyltransferase
VLAEVFGNIMDTANILDRLQDIFRAQNDDIACVYLFGSVARGQAGPHSDIDVAVLYADEPPPGMAGLGLRLAGNLERELGLPVDLVVLNRCSADLIHRVLRDGVLVLDRNPSARIRFEVQARNAYFDLKPILDRYRRTPGGATNG